MADRQKWSISEVKTVEGETMIVGGESYEFGLIAAVTNEADARQIIADRESHDALVKALTYAQIDLAAARDLVRQVLGEPHGLNQTIAIVEAALASTVGEQDRVGGGRG